MRGDLHARFAERPYGADAVPGTSVMSETTLVALALVVFVWAVLSEWLAAHDLTGPIVFLAAGLLLGNPDWGLVAVEIDNSTVHVLAELTLALLLFADASAVRLAAARRDLGLTSRLLGIGLPLSMAAGTLVAVVLFPGLPLALAGLIAASLAPTDAALSASVIADERLPARVRRVLNVESGLNDGIATPVVTFCIAASATALGMAEGELAGGFGALGDLVVGVAVGTAVALAGGRLLVVAHARGWLQDGSRRLATLSLALLAFLLASEAGGNGFVAAFVGGLVFGAAARADAEKSIELTEQGASLLSLVLWFVFGAAFVDPRVRGRRRPHRGLRGGQPHGRADGARGDRAGRLPAGPRHRGVHRLVRSPRARLGGLRAARRRGPRPRPPRRRRGGEHDRGHDRAQRRRPRDHRPAPGDPLRRRAGRQGRAGPGAPVRGTSAGPAGGPAGDRPGSGSGWRCRPPPRS